MTSQPGDVEDAKAATRSPIIETAAHSAQNEKYGSIRELVEADLLDERYEKTQRRLSSRHVQMMYGLFFSICLAFCNNQRLGVSVLIADELQGHWEERLEQVFSSVLVAHLQLAGQLRCSSVTF